MFNALVSRRRTSANHSTSSLPARSLARWTGPLLVPLALASRSEPFSGPGWLFELKYDGWRVLAAKDEAEVTLRLRSGRDATATFPEVADAIAALPAQRALLDGELVVFDADGRSDFEMLRTRALGRRTGPRYTDATAALFDVLALNDHDLRHVPLVERKQMLQELLSGRERLLYVEHVEDRGEQLLDGARRLGLEGVVAKRADSPYPSGRTGAWLKFKCEDTADFVVIGVAAPSRLTFMRPGLVLATVERDRLRYAGRVAVGRRELDALAVVVPRLWREWSLCPGAGRAETWIEPAIVAEVRYLASSRRGLRHAVFVRFRPDKPWQECVRERLSPA